jgi:outer membrane protein OmpA-like peptidoglycan-associated protein
MKKILLVTALGLSSAIASTTIQAADNKVEQNIGFGGGLIIGAIAGGPVGAIIGAVSGALLGEQVNEAEKVEPLTKQIAENKVHLESLQISLLNKNELLDRATVQLRDQEVVQLKVARNKELMTGLQVDLMFRTNSDQLESGAIEKIAPLVLMLEQFPQLELQLTGHGDVLGTDKGNTKVALLRTQSVKQAFTEAGINHDRIHLINAGKKSAAAAIEDVDGRALDRRVQIKFMQAVSKDQLAFNK